MTFKMPNQAGTNLPVPTGVIDHGDFLDTLSQDELLDLRAEIDSRLPGNTLKDVNMEKELVTQLAVVKRLQTDTLSDPSTPANQMAQVAGQVANVLGTLAKLQVEVYDSERMKGVEAALVTALNTLPSEAQEEFFAKYEPMVQAV